IIQRMLIGGPFPSWFGTAYLVRAPVCANWVPDARSGRPCVIRGRPLSLPAQRDSDLLGTLPEGLDDTQHDPADQCDRQDLEEQEPEHAGDEAEQSEQQLYGDQPDHCEYAARQQPGTHEPLRSSVLSNLRA